ncbi:TPA: hypothetical protein IAD52_05390 [Candidatus Spyradomonas excrementavium]|nr:hypothetical protein [Candidatus Spyradomonas excrementavium]
MTKMKLYKQAETMYIEGNTPIDVISQNLDISRRTLFYWKKKYEWDRKYFEKKNNREIFNQELLDFTKKFLNKLSKDIDNHIHASQSEIYSFLNILKNIPQVKQYENFKTKTRQQIIEPKPKQKTLSPEHFKQIENELFRIEYE